MARAKKDMESKVIEDLIIRGNINDVVSESMAEYSKYILLSRAIPDVRDSLKPVQRRILFGMEKLKNTYNRPTSKSAKSVGYIMGNYHPHGKLLPV